MPRLLSLRKRVLGAIGFEHCALAPTSIKVLSGSLNKLLLSTMTTQVKEYGMARMVRKSSSPVIPGKTRSSTRASGSPFWISINACSAECDTATSYPAFRRTKSSKRAMCRSSSTTKIRAGRPDAGSRLVRGALSPSALQRESKIYPQSLRGRSLYSLNG